MPVRASLTLRWVRASVLAAVALGTGAVAHVSAEGRLPGPGGLMVLTLACTALAAALLGRQASTLRLVALVVAGQGFVHTGLAAMAGHRGDPVAHPTHPLPAPTAPRTGSYFDQWEAAHPAAGSAPAVPAWLVHAVADVVEHPAMALAHVLAAAAVGLWLAAGERALFALLTLTAALALTLVRRLRDALAAIRVVPVPAPVRRTTYQVLRLPRRDVWARGPVRRGPPLLLAAA